jgi:hypothetical protein
MTKLVARKTQNSHIVAISRLDCVHSSQVGDGRASQRCNILDQDGLTLIL